jgi:replicative DNA helicase
LERILRSVITVGNAPEPEEALANWNKLLEHNLGFNNEEDSRIYDYLSKFYGQMAAPPDFTIVKDYFEKLDDVDVSSRLEEIKSSQHYIRTNFLSIVRSEQEGQQLKSFIVACRDAVNIAENGVNLSKPVDGKKIMRGVNDAMGFLFDKMSNFSHFESGEKLEGFVNEDSDEFLDEYDLATRTNTYQGRNVFGLEPVDEACEGHKSGEFWVHCAYPGELKTSLALNYAYNNAYIYGKNMFYGIFEMPYKQLRRQLYVIHSSHGKFMTDWYKEDLKAGRPNPYMGLDYRKVRDGKLDSLEYARLKIIAQDFKANSKGKMYVWRPPMQVTTDEIRKKAEMFHNKYGCDGIVLDNIGNIKPKMRSNDFVTMINSVVTECRFLALNFARGNTVPVLGLFHMNRQGKLRADKADGRYDAAAISYANQLEKDADVITYTYLNDQLRKDAKFYMGCIKNRDNPVFAQFTGKIFWNTKRMRAIETGLIDMNADRIIQTSNEISLTAMDMIA